MTDYDISLLIEESIQNIDAREKLINYFDMENYEPRWTIEDLQINTYLHPKENS